MLGIVDMGVKVDKGELINGEDVAAGCGFFVTSMRLRLCSRTCFGAF